MFRSSRVLPLVSLCRCCLATKSDEEIDATQSDTHKNCIPLRFPYCFNRYYNTFFASNSESVPLWSQRGSTTWYQTGKQRKDNCIGFHSAQTMFLHVQRRRQIPEKQDDIVREDRQVCSAVKILTTVKRAQIWTWVLCYTHRDGR